MSSCLIKTMRDFYLLWNPWDKLLIEFHLLLKFNNILSILAARCTKHSAYTGFGEGPHLGEWIVDSLTCFQWSIPRLKPVTFNFAYIILPILGFFNLKAKEKLGIPMYSYALISNIQYNRSKLANRKEMDTITKTSTSTFPMKNLLN